MSDGWREIGAMVAKTGAPILGGLLGGPAGAIGGTMVGKIIAAALGVEDTVDAIEAAIKLDPDAAVKLREAELRNQVELEKLAFEHTRLEIEAERAEINQVNETYRAELLSGTLFQRSWRPFFGYITALAYGSLLFAVAYVIVTNGEPQLIAALGSLTTFISAGLAVLGVTSWRRSTDKQTLAAIPKVGGLMDAVAHRIRKGGDDE